MVDLTHTPIAQIPGIRDTLKASFRAGVARPLAWRRNQLRQLARLLQDNAEAFVEALDKDLRKPRQETLMAEVGAMITRGLKTAAKLEEWAKPELVDVPDWQKSWQPTLNKAPLGAVLIIAPWNYPIVLSLQPLIGAIAAGCTAVVKPSELAPAYAQLLAELVPKYLDNSAYRVVNGGVQETTKLLDLQWDYIFYTGNGRVARIIAAAAAKHLTPTTLELGGKSPVIVDGNCDLNLAAKRIFWGKINNAGQICVAPDYVLIPREKQDEFVAALKTHYKAFFPEGALNSASFGRIVTPLHHSRIKGLLDRTKGEIAFGGQVSGNSGFEPTVVRDVQDGDSLLEEELFGPVLPIVPVDNMAQAIDFVNARPHPLVLYAFTQDPILKQKITEGTMSGNLAFNDTFQQLAVDELPFAGVGESGHGYQIVKYTYDGFTHLRATVDIPMQAEPFMTARYPPYDEKSEGFKLMTAAVKVKIPDNE